MALLLGFAPGRMISKKELARIPFLAGHWAGRFIFIDRQNAVAAREASTSGRRIRAVPRRSLPEARARVMARWPLQKAASTLPWRLGPIVPIALRGTALSCTGSLR